MSTKNPQAENIFHKSADGAGFSRLRAAQRQREEFTTMCKRSHPACDVYVDQIREYAGVQIVFYRVACPAWEHARVAVFQRTAAGWSKENDIIASQF